jgi:hypothetical protein
VVEGVDAGRCAEPGFPPGLLAERLGQALFEQLDAGGEQVGLQGGPADGRAAPLPAGGLACVAWILPSRSRCR